MLAQLALLSTMVVGLWIGLDAAARGPSRRRALSVLLLGLAIALWAGGELMLRHAAGPEERLLARRVLYLGPALLPVAWLWVGAQSARAEWIERRPWLLLLAALPGLIPYSCLYWDTQARYFDWTVEGPPTLGPLFYTHVAWAWTLVATGALYVLRAAARLGRAGLGRMIAIVVLTVVPFASNALFVIFRIWSEDVTPMWLSLSGVLLRFAVLDSGLAAFLPIARRDVIDQLHQGVLVIDLDGRVVDANPAAGSLLGRDKLVGERFAEIVEPALEAPGRSLEVETIPVRGPIGEVGSCAVISDRTEARRMERQLLQAQRLEGVGILTAGIAHEVNNPLAFIRANFSYLEALTKDLADPAVRELLPPDVAERTLEVAEILAETRDGVDRIAKLVRDLKNFAGPGGTNRESRPVDMREVAERARSLASVGIRPDALRIRLEPLPPIHGNEGELVQILLNLFVNAIQAGGDEPRIEVDLRSVRGGVLVTVRDHGPGIEPTVLPRLFDPFFTTKAPGTGMGLGLSLSFDLARAHGGTLDAANHDEGGAVFHLWLPASPAEPG